MNKFTLSDKKGNIIVENKELYRISVTQNGIAIMAKGSFDKNLSSIPKNKLLSLKVYSGDVVEIEETVTAVSYNFLISVADDGESTYITDNTILFNLME